MGIEQHLVALAGIRNQPICTTGAQLHMRDLNASKQAADQQSNWKTSPNANVSGTNARKDLRCSPRHERMKAVSWL
jgi:hypothetical protein